MASTPVKESLQILLNGKSKPLDCFINKSRLLWVTPTPAAEKHFKGIKNFFRCSSKARLTTGLAFELPFPQRKTRCYILSTLIQEADVPINFASRKFKAELIKAYNYNYKKNKFLAVSIREVSHLQRPAQTCITTKSYN